MLYITRNNKQAKYARKQAKRSLYEDRDAKRESKQYRRALSAIDTEQLYAIPYGVNIRDLILLAEADEDYGEDDWL